MEEKEQNFIDKITEEVDKYKNIEDKREKVVCLENIILLTGEENPKYETLDSDDRDNVDMIYIYSNKILEEMGKHFTFWKDKRISENEENMYEYTENLKNTQEQSHSINDIKYKLDYFSNELR